MTCSKKPILTLWRLLPVLCALVLSRVPASAAAVTQEDSTQAASAATSSDSVVPHLIQFSGMVKDTEGKPAANSVQLTFSLYQSEEGGSPLWVETQTVQLDSEEHYTVLLGAASPSGLPLDIFATGAGRWLGVQPALPGAGEQPRVLLVGVPYAFKAADAETLGGKPASAYVTTETFNATGTSQAGTASTATGGQNPPSGATGSQHRQTSGANPSTTCSSITADGTATANQVAKFTAACKIHQSLLFDSGTDVGVGTTTPAATLDVNGNISGRDNLGLPQTTGSSLGVITLGGSRFIHACCSSSSHNTFLGVNAGPLSGGGNSNTATGFQALNALTSGFSNTAIGTDALQFNNTGTDNTAIGLGALDLNTAGGFNTAVGENALEQNNGGGDNTGIGSIALNENTSGAKNTAIGDEALISNTTGNFNAALGFDANVNSGNLTNATAIGANSLVSESNAIVLGCTFNCASGTSQPFVGIGTTTPLAPLDVLANGSSIHTLIGNVGCGNSNAGIIFATTLVENCQTYAISGDTAGNTYLDAPGGGLHLRISPNTDALVIDTHANATISGNLTVTGTLSKGSGSFKIDHPLDPANKYLYHSFVESPDMMDIYNGNVTTDKQGLAVVVLPNYFEALNRDFRYQLTPIGKFAQVVVAKKIVNNRFVIRTNKPGVEVSWQVTGIRHDAYADAHRIPVEEEKPLQEQGKYLHPELFGAPAEKAVGYSAPLSPSAAVPTPVALSASTPIGAGQQLTFPAPPVRTTASDAPVEPVAGVK